MVECCLSCPTATGSYVATLVKKAGFTLVWIRDALCPSLSSTTQTIKALFLFTLDRSKLHPVCTGIDQWS